MEYAEQLQVGIWKVRAVTSYYTDTIESNSKSDKGRINNEDNV